MTKAATGGNDQWTARQQIFALLVGPMAYSVYFIAVYLMAEAACITGILMARVAGVPLMLAIVVTLGLLTLMLIGYGGWLAFRGQRAGGKDGLDVVQRDAFMALAALLLASLFFLSTVITALSVLLYNPCRWT